MVKRLLLSLFFALSLMTAAPASAQSGSISTTTCPGAGCYSLRTNAAGTVGIQITGTFNGTLQFEQSIDETNWESMAMYPLGSTDPVTSATDEGYWTGVAAGAKRVRVRFSAFTSGTATVNVAFASAKMNVPSAPDEVAGVTFPENPSTDTVPVVTAANTITYKAIADCDDTDGNHLNYDTTTHAFSCGDSSSGGPGGAGDRIVRDFTVAANQTISVGDVVSVVDDEVVKGAAMSFGAANTTNGSYFWSSSASTTPSQPLSFMLDATHAVVTYGASGSTNRAAAVLTLNGDGTFSLGSGTVINAGWLTTDLSTVRPLSASSFYVVYLDRNNSTRVSVVVGTISGGSITFGTTVQVSTLTAMTNIFTEPLDSTHLVISYPGTSSHPTNVVASISGDTVTLGTPVESSSSTTAQQSPILVLDSTHYVTTFADSTNSGRYTTKAAEVSAGTTITFGSGVTYNNTTSNPTLRGHRKISSSSFLVIFPDSANTRLSAVAASVSTTTITQGSVVAVGSTSNTTLNGVAALSSTAYVVGGAANVTALTVSGTTVTSGSTVTVADAISFSPTILRASDATHFAYCGASGSTPGSVRCGGGTVSGSTITLAGYFAMPGTPVTNSYQESFSMAPVDSSSFVTAFADTNTGATYIALMGFDSGGTFTAFYSGYTNPRSDSSANTRFAWVQNVASNSVLFFESNVTTTPVLRLLSSYGAPGGLMGVALDAGTAGQTVAVTLQGVADGLSSLIPGALYYTDVDGSKGRLATGGIPLGRALSATELNVTWSER